MKILSLGWGVQSFTILAMSSLGELDKIDFAIHADTTYESLLTYQFINKWKGWVEEKGIKVVTVKNPISDLPNKLNGGYNQLFIPAYTLSNAGKSGSLLRTCTGRWKIAPMRKYLSQFKKEGIEQWMGISMDEYQRMKHSDVKYITNRYPLIEKKMTRDDCTNWLLEHNLEVPPKSSCTFCPYHSVKEWQNVISNKEDFESAVGMDRAIRNKRNGYQTFLSPARKPLDQIDFRTEEEKGQMNLWDNECAGICGI